MNKKYLLAILVFVAALALAYFANFNNNQKGANSKLVDNSANNGVHTSTNTKKSAYEIIDEGFVKKYTNNNDKYSFEFPSNMDLYICPDSPCMAIESQNIRIEQIDYSSRPNNLTEYLMEDDLYCTADGIQGSIYCKNKVVSEFKSQSGVEGYKVDDIKIYENRTLNKTSESPHATYVFPINTSEHKAILFTVDLVTQDNTRYLDMIANSFQKF